MHHARPAKDTLVAFNLSEFASGSDAFSLRTRTKKVDGGWKLSGRKMWVTSSREAGLLLVFAIVVPETKLCGVTSFLLDPRRRYFFVEEDLLG